ncbi:ribonuclease H-like domain-containing protein [Tanacetum coccineum]
MEHKNGAIIYHTNLLFGEVLESDAHVLHLASAGIEENTSSTNEAVNTAHEVSTPSSQGQTSSSTYADDVIDGSQIVGGHAYHEGEEILKEDRKESEFQWQIHYGIGGYDWSSQAEEGITNLALMALRIIRSIGIVVQEKNEAVYEEDIAFLKYDVQLKYISIKDLKNQLEEALKEKDDLKLKLEKFEESSKNLTKLINSQISAKEKAGIGYDSQMNESEVVHSVFNSRESDVDDSPVNDRFKIGEGFHTVPPPYTGNYMPSRPDLSFAGLDDSVYKTKVSKNETSISKTRKDIVEKPKTIRPSAHIIEDWDTNSDNDSVFRPKPDQTKPKFTKINFVKSDKNVKFVNKENTHRQEEYPRKSQNPRDNRRNWNRMMTQKLGNGFEFIKKACFVCRSFNHLIKDCDFHDKKMVEKPVLNNKGRVTSQREIRPVWNNVQRVNHQNKFTHPHPKMNFVPTSVVTKLGQVIVNAAKQSSLRATTSICTTMPVNTAAPKSKVNDALLTTYSYFKAHSPIRRAFNQKLAAKTNNFNEKVNTARVNNVTTAGPKAVVSAAEGNGENAVKSSACWIWRPTGNVIDDTSKDSGSYMLKRFDYVDLQGRLKSQIHATVDGKTVVISESSVRSDLHFNDEDGITCLTNDAIFENLALIGCDNGAEFKNNDTNQFCGIKGIKREFSVSRTSQQNRVAERKNRTLIEAARTMLADSLLPTTFWAEAISTAYYV